MDNTTTNVQGWISVKDRLPDTDFKHGNYYSSGVLLTYDGDSYGVGEYVVATVGDNNKWYNSADDEVTHWMPLPAPPSEGLVVSEGLIDHGV